MNMKTPLGVPHDAVWHPTIQKASDELCQEFFDLDVPVPAPDKASQTLRTKREKRAAAVEQRDRLLAEGQKEEAAKVDVPYIWQDDLRARVLEAAAASKDEEDFFRQLTLRGVEGTRRKATRKQPEYYLYELVDTSGFSSLDSIPANLRSKSFKMGADYQPEGVAAMFRKEKTGVKDYAPKNDLVESPVRDETASGNTNRPPEKKTREIASETPQTAISPERANRDPYAMLNTGKKGHRDGGKTSGSIRSRFLKSRSWILRKRLGVPLPLPKNAKRISSARSRNGGSSLKSRLTIPGSWVHKVHKLKYTKPQVLLFHVFTYNRRNSPYLSINILRYINRSLLCFGSLCFSPGCSVEQNYQTYCYHAL